MPETGKHRNLAALKVFNDYLRELLDSIKKRKRKKKRKKPPAPQRKTPLKPGPPVVWVPGSGQAEGQVLVDVGRTPGGGKGKGPCKMNGTDRFAVLQFLLCRCRQGDQSACKAAAKLQGQETADLAGRNQGSSGGGGGGGF